VSKAQWHKPAAVKVQFGNACILKNRRLVFNGKGNDCLVVATLAYDTGVVFVKFEPHAPCLGRHRRRPRGTGLTILDIRPIKTGADHWAALPEVSAPVAKDPALDTPEGDRLDVLVTLVQA
jgi:HigB_toxin, RelE-like toxic component of a toxin-antitoxin system